MEIIFPVYQFSFAEGATRLLCGASPLAELSLITYGEHLFPLFWLFIYTCVGQDYTFFKVKADQHQARHLRFCLRGQLPPE